MNKQIEDMRGDLIEIFDKEYDERQLITPHNTAEKLTALGYRKSTDVAREIFAEIEAMPTAKDFTIKSQDFEFGYRLAIQEILAELKKKYESEGADDEVLDE